MGAAVSKLKFRVGRERRRNQIVSPGPSSPTRTLPAPRTETQSSVVNAGVPHPENAPYSARSRTAPNPPTPPTPPSPHTTLNPPTTTYPPAAPLNPNSRPSPINPPTIASSNNSGRPLPQTRLEPTPTTSLTAPPLWKQAVDKLQDDDRKYITKSDGSIYRFNDLIEEINEKKEQCDGKRWFYTNNRGENVYYLEILTGQLNKYAQLGDVALQHNPDIVALAWAGFRFLLQVGTAYTEHMRIVSENVGCVTRILVHCDVYEKIYCGTDIHAVGLLEASLVDLYVSILEYLCYARRFISGRTGKRVLESFFSTLAKLLAAVKESEKEVERNANIVEKAASAVAHATTQALENMLSPNKMLLPNMKPSPMAVAAARERQSKATKEAKANKALRKQLTALKEPLENIEDIVQMVYEATLSDRRAKILNWLSDIKFADHHSFSSGRRQENTGEWLRDNETFKEWRNSKSSSLLWLRGDAGYGKTILVSYVIDEFQHQAKSNEHVLAYFYCNYKEDDRRKPETVLRTLVKQFCLKSPGDPNLVPKLVSLAYEERERQGHASGPLQCQESTDLIINLSKIYLQVTIIVDALDECYQDTRSSLFYALKCLVESGSNVKVFLASRYEQDIARMFAGYKCHYIQASDNTKDINDYIDLQLDIRCDPRKCKTEQLLLDGDASDELKEEIRFTLKEKANGMFMWVNLQILALCEEPTEGCVREALEKLPKDLKETYGLIIERIEARDSSSRIAYSVLSWLLYARQACSLTTILQAFSVGPGENQFDRDILKLTMSRILDCCKNLVVHDTNLQNLRFAHFSVQEYLLTNPKFKDETKNHTMMAEICLKALLYHHSMLKSRQIDKLMQYARENWGEHVRLSGPLLPTSLLYKLCMEFLKPSKPYNAWGPPAAKGNKDFAGSKTDFVSPLWVACYYGLYGFIDVIIAAGTPNESNYEGWTPLSWAAVKGHDKVVELLLQDTRIDLNVRNDGWTPLSWAAEKGHDKVVERLLQDARVDVNVIRDGWTPLAWAAEKGRNKVVELLLQHSGIDVNLPKDDRTPLSWAAEKGHSKVVELLLQDSRIGINLADSAYHQTPLSWAVEKGHGEVVELLLRDSRVDVSSQDMNGRTALLWAAEKGHDKMVELFLRDDRVDVKLTDNDGRTPLSSAAEGGHNKVVELLLRDSRVDVNQTDGEGRTPFSLAAEAGHDKVLERLLRDSRVDVNLAESRYRQTPLSWAVEYNREKAVKLLLQDSRVDVNSADKNGRTPLSWASAKGHSKVVILLLRHRHLNVNLANKSGRTPLSSASERGHEEVVELLLRDRRVDVNLTDNDGRTPLAWAKANNHDWIVELLSYKRG